MASSRVLSGVANPIGSFRQWNLSSLYLGRTYRYTGCAITNRVTQLWDVRTGKQLQRLDSHVLLAQPTTGLSSYACARISIEQKEKVFHMSLTMAGLEEVSPKQAPLRDKSVEHKVGNLRSGQSKIRVRTSHQISLGTR